MSEREFESYLSAITKLLRLKPTQRDAIATELRDHLESRLEELTAKGVDRDTAIQRALDEFGDAAALGHDLTAPHRHQFRRRMMQTSLTAAAVAAVVVLGVTALLPTRSPAVRQVVADEAVQQLGAASTHAASELSDLGRPWTVHVNVPGGRGAIYQVLSGQTLTLARLFIETHEARTPDGENPDFVVSLLRVSPDGSNAKRIQIGRWALPQITHLGAGKDIVLQPNDEVLIERAPWADGSAGAQAPATVHVRAIIDLIPLFAAATGESREHLATGEWLRESETEFVDRLADVLLGMGYEQTEDFGTISSWMGLMTVVGSERVIQTSREYVEEMRTALRERRDAEAAEGGDGKASDDAAASVTHFSAGSIVIRSGTASEDAAASVAP